MSKNILDESQETEFNKDGGEMENKILNLNIIRNESQKDLKNEIIGSNNCKKIDDMKLVISQMSIKYNFETNLHGSKNNFRENNECQKQEEEMKDREMQEEKEMASYLLLLSEVNREICHLCGGRRQIYCGDCGGVRLDQAESLLPSRVVLPFDVLLIVHW